MNPDKEYEKLIDNIYSCIYKIETSYETITNSDNRMDLNMIKINLMNLNPNNFVCNFKIMEDILRYDFIHNKECYKFKKTIKYMSNYFYCKGSLRIQKCIICNIEYNSMIVSCKNCNKIQEYIKCQGCYINDNLLKIKKFQDILNKKYSEKIENIFKKILSHLQILKSIEFKKNIENIEILVKNKDYSDYIYIFKILCSIDLDIITNNSNYIKDSKHLKDLFKIIKSYFLFRNYIEIDHCFNKKCKKKLIIFKKCLFCNDNLYVLCPKCKIAKYCSWSCFLVDEDLHLNKCEINYDCISDMKIFLPGLYKCYSDNIII